MAIVWQKVAHEKLLNKNEVRVLICSDNLKLLGDALMKLIENQEAHFSTANIRLFYDDRLYLAIDSLKKLLPDRFDQRNIPEKNFKDLSVLVVVIL